jgi:D-hexose-6-phosphate mutarotase
VDAALGRQIVITTENSNSAVIWNPWIEKSTTMSDFPADGYLTMVCVETCNAMEDTRVIAPGASHALKAAYSIQPL